ncbi:MAG: response regulator [Rhodospirillaceae bacterium]|nr:response regulator [Rhodospirillaceae bacterium]
MTEQKPEPPVGQTAGPIRRLEHILRGLGVRRIESATEDGDEPPDRPVVMVVDDDPPIRDTVCLALHSRGYDVLRASDGREALSLLEDLPHGVDVLITDVVMPGLDGPGLAAAVASRHPDTHIIFMSGYENRVPENRRRLDKSQLCLFKPFPLAMLEQALSNALHHAPVA